MDSKLIGSNIAFSSRYEIVHDTLVLFYNEMIKTTPIKLSGEEKDNKHYPLLKGVFDEDFRVGENGQTEISPKEEIKSDSVQSTNDTECAYRNDTQTVEIIPSYKNRSGKWTIKIDKGYRYFSDHQIETCNLRKQIELILIVTLYMDKPEKNYNFRGTDLSKSVFFNQFASSTWPFT